MSDASKDTVEIYRGNDANWHWRRKASNGEIVSTSGEGFINKSWAEKSARTRNSDVPEVQVRFA